MSFDAYVQLSKIVCVPIVCVCLYIIMEFVLFKCYTFRRFAGPLYMLAN